MSVKTRSTVVVVVVVVVRAVRCPTCRGSARVKERFFVSYADLPICRSAGLWDTDAPWVAQAPDALSEPRLSAPILRARLLELGDPNAEVAIAHRAKAGVRDFYREHDTFHRGSRRSATTTWPG